jgi:hypothetical protein
MTLLKSNGRSRGKVKGPALANYRLERGTLEIVCDAVSKCTLLGFGWGGGIPCLEYTRRPLLRKWRALEKS